MKGEVRDRRLPARQREGLQAAGPIDRLARGRGAGHLERVRMARLVKDLEAEAAVGPRGQVGQGHGQVAKDEESKRAVPVSTSLGVSYVPPYARCILVRVVEAATMPPSSASSWDPLAEYVATPVCR